MTDLQNFNNLNDITWDDPATPLAEPVLPLIDPNGWHWYPDANGQLFTLYFDADGNECMMWQVQDDDSYYWRCAGVGYTCRDIGIEGRRGIFFQDLLVGSMILDQYLTVEWLPETYIPQNQIINIDNDIHDINIIDISDDSDDNYDP
jgi:hypothetical protein